LRAFQALLTGHGVFLGGISFVISELEWPPVFYGIGKSMLLLCEASPEIVRMARVKLAIFKLLRIET